MYNLSKFAVANVYNLSIGGEPFIIINPTIGNNHLLRNFRISFFLNSPDIELWYKEFLEDIEYAIVSAFSKNLLLDEEYVRENTNIELYKNDFGLDSYIKVSLGIKGYIDGYEEKENLLFRRAFSVMNNMLSFNDHFRDLGNHAPANLIEAINKIDIINSEDDFYKFGLDTEDLAYICKVIVDNKDLYELAFALDENDTILNISSYLDGDDMEEGNLQTLDLNTIKDNHEDTPYLASYYKSPTL